MGDEAKEKAPETAKKIVHTYPLIRHSDMPEEMKQEAIDFAVTACEKFSTNNEAAARMVKEEMDKKYGPPFNVVVGEAFGFEVSYVVKNILYMFFGGNVAVVIWKC